MATRVPKLSAPAKKLLQLVPPDGEFIGNRNLQRRARVGKVYWKLRSELVDAGLLVKGKGRGGSVRLVGDAETRPKAAQKEKAMVRRESELYEPLSGWLRDEWGKDVEPGDFFEVLVTATGKAKKRAGGQWTRPDVTIVQVNSYEFFPQPVLEVTTFEVKRFADAENIRSVYEAAAHSRWAHFSYLVAEVPDDDYEFPERFTSELERFDVGLIRMRKGKKQWHFEVLEWETDRLSPQPDQLNALLETFFRQSKRKKEFMKALGKG